MLIDPNIALVLPIEPQDHTQGPADAPLTLLWYGDYECDYCGRAFPIVKQLQADFGDRLQLVYRHFPVANIHPHASAAAQAAEAAGAQQKFWEMHDVLFEQQDKLADADLSHYAMRVGLEIYKFQADLSSQRFSKRVRRDYQSGLQSSVKGTPSFFINGFKFVGQPDLESLTAALNEAAAAR